MFVPEIVMVRNTAVLIECPAVGFGIARDPGSNRTERLVCD